MIKNVRQIIALCKQTAHPQTLALRRQYLSPLNQEMMTARQKYDLELDNNVRMLCMKYPNEPGVKIKELLEELENNPQMV